MATEKMKSLPEMTVIEVNWLKHGLTVLGASIKRSITTEKSPEVKAIRERELNEIGALMNKL